MAILGEHCSRRWKESIIDVTHINFMAFDYFDMKSLQNKFGGNFLTSKSSN